MIIRNEFIYFSERLNQVLHPPLRSTSLLWLPESKISKCGRRRPTTIGAHTFSSSELWQIKGRREMFALHPKGFRPFPFATTAKKIQSIELSDRSAIPALKRHRSTATRWKRSPLALIFNTKCAVCVCRGSGDFKHHHEVGRLFIDTVPVEFAYLLRQHQQEIYSEGEEMPTLERRTFRCLI